MENNDYKGMIQWLWEKSCEAETEEALYDQLRRALEEKTDAEKFRSPENALVLDDGTKLCPRCLIQIKKIFGHPNYCPNCGQALEWQKLEVFRGE